MCGDFSPAAENCATSTWNSLMLATSTKKEMQSILMLPALTTTKGTHCSISIRRSTRAGPVCPVPTDIRVNHLLTAQPPVGWSLLRAVVLPPAGTGGETEFADSRTAWDDLDDDTKKRLLERDYIGAHTLLHSRKKASPDFFADLDPTSQPMTRHRLVQTHEPSGRKNIYAGAHCHHLETDHGPLPEAESNALLKRLMDHITQPKYVLSVDWVNVGDMVAWDNRCVFHRATGGSFEGKYVRDMRRTTVHDDSPTAWGLNAGQEARGFNLQKAMGESKVESAPAVQAST